MAELPINRHTSDSESIVEFDLETMVSRSTWNTSAPISRLPDEVLLLIFQHYNEPPFSPILDPAKYMKYVSDMKWREFIKVTHICSHWRSVVLESPSLWSRIIFTRISVIEEMLSRSQKCPLFIGVPRWFITDNLAPSLRDKLLDMERIQELHVSLNERHLDLLLNCNLGTHAKQLRSLSIRANPTRGMFWTQDHFYTLPPKILSMSMPRLNHVKFTNCAMDWDLFRSCFSPALVTLILSRVSRPSMKQFLELLSLSPNLEILHIHWSRNTMHDLSSSSKDISIPVVALPKLSSLTVKAFTFASFLELQTHVLYPVYNANIHFHLLPDETWLSSLEAFLVSCGLSPLNPRRSHTNLLLECLEPFRITLWDRTSQTSPLELYALPVNTNPSVFFDLIHSHTLWQQACLLRQISIPTLSTVSIIGNHCAAVNEWHDFFQRHSGITRLCIGSHIHPAVLSIFSALTLPSNNAEDSDHTDGMNLPASGTPGSTIYQPCLPDLRVLTLKDHKGEEKSTYYADSRVIFDGLAERRRLGSPLQTLELIRCYWIDENIVSMLREVVGEVNWDGKRLSSGQHNMEFPSLAINEEWEDDEGVLWEFIDND